MSDAVTVTIPAWAQGRPGWGQGGWCAGRFEAVVGRPLVVDFRAPVPLETPLRVVATDDGWEARHGDDLILRGRPRDTTTATFSDTDPVTIEEAAAGRARFAVSDDEHNAPDCFSCGIRPRTMGVRPGLLPDGSGRVASDWVPPDWVAGADGFVDPPVVWTVMDCASGFYVGRHPEPRPAVTARYTAEVLAPIEVGASYAIVAWSGSSPPAWDGRKRIAAAAVFDARGQVVARADSLWVAPRDE